MKHLYKIPLVTLITLICLVGLTGANQSAPTSEPARKLFSDPVQSISPTAELQRLQTRERQDPTIHRSRLTTINLKHLEKADSIVLNLFDNISKTAVRERLTRRSKNSYSWFGRIQGSEYSFAILTVEKGDMAGNITIDGKLYQVRPADNGIHSIREIDRSAFPDEAPPLEMQSEQSQDIQITLPESEFDDSGALIDVMVVYTQDAANASFNINAEIQLAIDETNQSYINSVLNPRVRLVHTAQIAYFETGSLSLDVSRLQNPSDGYMDEVHTLRNQYNADMVVLIVENGGFYCGIAYAIMSPVSPAFEDKAFCVADRGCATGNYTFGHELGHLQSARHDWYVDPTDFSPFTYNHGYVSPNYDWRTVMAYSNACSGCPRLLYWSNPDVQFGGLPMGVPEGQYQAADNRKTLNNTAYTVANFRVSGSELFSDVPTGYWAEEAIYKVFNAGITSGCATNPLRFCPEDTVTRAQMAVFLTKGKRGAGFTPPPAVGIFSDVPTSYWAADWIEQFYNDGITGGCGTNPLRYCPADAVTRAQMAVFLLKAKYGENYTPPPATGKFSDVPVSYWAADWIEQLSNEGITSGCGTNPLRYCPTASVTRAEMAVFIVRTFGL